MTCATDRGKRQVTKTDFDRLRNNVSNYEGVANDRNKTKKLSRKGKPKKKRG
jgi:hypothetical protein